MSDCNAPLAFLVGVSSFMMFKNMRVGYNKVINMIGGTTFGIYLIHDNNDAMRQWLWNESLNVSEAFYSNMIYLHAILTPICIFVVCSFFDVLRMKILEIPLLTMFDKYLKTNNNQIR